MSNEQMAAVLSLIQAIWPEKTQWGGGTVRVYAELLGDLDPDDLVAAVKFLGRTEEWPPTPAVVRRRVLASCLAPPPYEAIAAVRRCLDADSGASFAGLHPALSAALEGALDGSGQDWGLDEGRFLRLYGEARQEFDRDQLGKDRRREIGPGE